MIDIVQSTLKKKKVVITAVVLIAVLIFAFKLMADQKPAEAMQDNALTVEAAEATMTDSLKGLTYKANLEPMEEAIVSSNASGQVTQVLFENGDQVVQGQVLAYLNDKDLQNQLKAAQISLNQLQAELASKQNDYGIAKELYQSGAYSKTSFDAAQLAYQTALSSVELKKVAIQDINNSLNDYVIRSAISGEIGGKNISVGQYVNMGAALATVKNNTAIKAVIQLMQGDLSKVAVGQTVELRVGEKESQRFEGVVETIAASADNQTRVFDCLIKVSNPDGTLHSGVTGTIEIAEEGKKEVLVIPMTALTGSEGDYSVFTIEDHTAHKVAVTIGEISEDMVEITSGIQEGEKIIISNLNSIQDGDKVTVSGKGK
ncbi:efflux RND transporter periplasmic adaptor subunit [Clostridium aminobutyricum]|uniref:Efflux RND transporter periplasmic adaptor subunit n=1 Tax=Clostridium aminobutyricum TaxID=33953 RepID=A0A939D9Z9_CLOAM|nr:efflux RND transporter periplasmic adaptor subunit [Clostridium aminobutyricum]MBN7773448.1 efflux RND transporter periplasmic adaptor subunit [Clostridium aminobutyricum]